MRKKPKTKEHKTTQAELARQAGTTRHVIAWHLKHSNPPPLHDVPGWIAHLAAHGRSGSAPPELRAKIAQKRLEILEQTRIRLEYDNQVRKGELMPVADACRQAAEACSYLMSELERIEREAPPSLAGCTAVESYKILHAAVERLRRDAKAKFEAIGA